MLPFGIAPNINRPRRPNFMVNASAPFLGDDGISAPRMASPSMSGPSMSPSMDATMSAPTMVSARRVGGPAPFASMSYPMAGRAAGAPTMSSPGFPAPMISGEDRYAATHSPLWMSSLDRSRAEAERERQGTGAFVFAQQSGLSAPDAHRAAYMFKHGGPFESDPYGQVTQPGPQLFIGSGSGRSSGTPSFVAPPGAEVNIMGAPNIAGAKPFNPNDQTTLAKVLTGNPRRPTTAPADAYRMAGDLMTEARTKATPAPTTQPTVEALPTTPVHAPPEPAGGKRGINVSYQQAHAMLNAIQKANPRLSPDDLRGHFTLKLGEYGVSEDRANSIFHAWNNAGALGEQHAPNQATPGVRLPLSMLGASNGLDPHQNYNAARQAEPGQFINTPGTTRRGEAIPLPGNDPIMPPTSAQPQAGQSNRPTRAMAQQAIHQYGDVDTAMRALHSQGYDVSGYAD